MIRIAISGAGAIAERAHIPAFRAIPEAQIVAIQSRTRDKAERLATALWPDAARRPPSFSDYDEMLERERPDAVFVFGPNHTHCDFTLKAIAAGAHVLVEKPMAPATAEARRMLEAAGSANRILMVAMQRRYGALEKTIKRAVASGAIGEPHFIRARLSHGGPELWAPGQDWFFSRKEAGGGAMLDLGVHVADLAIWIMGEVESVMGQIYTQRRQIDVEDNGAMIMQFRSGALGVIEASWSSRPGLSSIEIYGSDGRVMLGYPRLDISIQRGDGTPAPGFSREEIVAGFDPQDYLAPSRALAARFVDAVLGRAEPSPDGLDGLRAVQAVEACYRSAATGARIALPFDETSLL
ncbi:MAG TPA: Gfo/Idh/MocA family oxidoreductase [Candidatus Binataceae bacterium]